MGFELEPSEELTKLWSQHNRHKIRTGAEADAEVFWEDVDSVFILITWVISEDSEFIGKGGVWVGTQGEELWICPVDPRVAIGLEGRRASAQGDDVPDPLRFDKVCVVRRGAVSAMPEEPADQQQTFSGP